MAGTRSTVSRQPLTPADCAHCDLPLGRWPVTAVIAGQRRSFCCYGCVLALQVTGASGDSGAAAAILVRLGLATFFAMNVMMLSMPAYVPYVYGAAVQADGPLFHVLRTLAAIFATPVLLLLGWPILRSALDGLRRGGLNTDALIVLGTAAAYGLSLANLLSVRGAVYFDTAAMLLVLVTLGRYLEARAKADASAAVRGLAAAPERATRLRAGGAESVPATDLLPGDVVRVGPGQAFPADGCVQEGTGHVDEAALTGENRPVVKEPGDEVASGTCSVDAVFSVRLTASTADSAAARVAALLHAARRDRAPIERLVDRVAAVLTPTVICIALVAGGFWTGQSGIERGVMVALAVLAVACPCGLGIAAPLAVWTGLGAAARRGVVVRSAAALERAAHVGAVLFDKTGTLTERVPRLRAIEVVPGTPFSETDLLQAAAALEAPLAHPFATAILGALPGAVTAAMLPTARGIQLVPGRGVRGEVAGQMLAAGSLRFAVEELGPSIELARYADSAGSTVLVWEPQRLLGVLRFEEVPRASAPAAIEELEQLGLPVGLLSGDARADAVVPHLIAPQAAAVGLLPAQKLEHVRARPRMAMVGDGINDAPALAAAHLGIAVGSGADLARVHADVVVMSDDLQRVPWLIVHARRTMRRVRQNVFWAFAYNAGAVAAAAAGALTPLVAAVAMLTSSLVVVANARR